MLPEKPLAWGQSRSCIRELFEYGAARKAVIGEDKVFDFSIGNPSIPAPACVNEAIAEALKEDSVQLHGYTSAPGRMSLRQAIADDLNKKYGTAVTAGDIYVTCGAASGLATCMKALLLPGEEVIAFAPFFPEYRVFTEAVGGVLVTVPPRAGDFQIDYAAFEAAISEKTKAVIVNSPNNPSGVVLSAESIRGLADILNKYEQKFGHEIYLVCDEPYRELVYGDVEVPCMMNFYNDTILCYSFSKSLSIPGERMGYIAVSDKMTDRSLVNAAVAGGARALGYINAPSLMQRVIEKCLGATADISKYQENRDLLYGGLTALGYECVKPDGAFYLFVKALEPDAKAFSEKAKKHELLLVPSDDFGCPGYVRVAYCVAQKTIGDAMPAFAALAKEYGL